MLSNMVINSHTLISESKLAALCQAHKILSESLIVLHLTNSVGRDEGYKVEGNTSAEADKPKDSYNQKVH